MSAAPLLQTRLIGKGRRLSLPSCRRRHGECFSHPAQQTSLFPATRQSKARTRQVHASAADGAAAGGDDKPAFGSVEWRTRPAAVSLPGSARNPGAWFVLAGFVKIAALTMSMGTSPFGGFSDLLVVVPVAIGLGLMARWVDQNDLMQKKWFARILVVAMLAFLYISSLAHRRTQVKRWARQAAAEPQTAAVAQPRRPAPRRLPTAAEAEAAGVKWERPTREWRSRDK